MIKDLFNEELTSFRKNFNFFINLYDKRKLPQTLLFTGEKGIGKFNFSYHLINYILSKDEDYKYDTKKYKVNLNNKTNKLISQNVHPNFYFISPKDKKNIDISQIKNLKNFLNISSLNDKPKIILINESEYLNLSSSNSLLKSLEENYDNVHFFLVHDSKKRLIPTIKSRCIQFKFYLNEDELKDRINQILNNQYEKLNSDFKNKYLSPIFYKDLFLYCKKNDLPLDRINLDSLLTDIFLKKNFKNNEFLLNNFFLLSQLFLHNRIKSDPKKEKYYLLTKHLAQRFNDVIKYNLDFESYVIEFKHLAYNEK
ncbi:hypothetical protein [Candidatus Pelagibacter communis]|uniref:hypothetical protein n=1 Tax=Pelagibacter ubique TaxID=198252 RepID=UPI00094C0653|nr:hypothetical protein [Candidatus Pelagibacter ubique]